MYPDRYLALVRALSRRGAYDEKVRYIRKKETHISIVFLTGDYAYKMKKPVRYNFLDYSTFALRKAFCLKEVEINSHLSPELYVGAFPLKKDGGVHVGGRGRIVEYLVKMREIPQKYMMSDLLAHGKVTGAPIKEIARMIAGFHEGYGRRKEARKYGGYGWVKKNCMDNFSDARHLTSGLIVKEEFNSVEERTRSFLKKNRHLFGERLRKGRIRATHGDLHSGNIFISDKVYIFDAVEFNPEIYCTDVAAEIAFLCMDLDRYDPSLSRLFCDEYVALTGDADLPQLLDFYKCYRAMVRTKIFGFSPHTRTLARTYFTLAAGYAGEF